MRLARYENESSGSPLGNRCDIEALIYSYMNNHGQATSGVVSTCLLSGCMIVPLRWGYNKAFLMLWISLMGETKSTQFDMHQSGLEAGFDSARIVWIQDFENPINFIGCRIVWRSKDQAWLHLERCCWSSFVNSQMYKDRKVHQDAHSENDFTFSWSQNPSLERLQCLICWSSTIWWRLRMLIRAFERHHMSGDDRKW